jgi:4-diphosphocytidyl-2-C-methyl-D-erythritol kinase
MSDQTVTSLAHAKINLFLRVFGKDASGFHGIETVFSLIELADRVSVTRADKDVTIDVTGHDVGPAEDNLAARAAGEALESLGNPFGVHIDLEKLIPVGGGLGGGSADAAAVLHCVNHLGGNKISPDELMRIGAKLGSDVPFLVTGKPMALAWNRGERLFTFDPPGSKPVVLLTPSFGVSTAEAYKLLDRTDGGGRGPVTLSKNAFETWGDVARSGGNDFESVVFGKHKPLKEMFFKLANTGPILARMSGTGSTLYGIYRDQSSAEDAMNILAGKSVATLTSTRDKAVAPPHR